MFSSKYFDVVKSSVSEAWKIRLWLIVLFAVIFFLILYSPFKPLFNYLGFAESTGCPFLTFTGIPCPTCGMGRGLWSIIRFDTVHMFYHNPSSIFFYLFTFMSVLIVFVLSIFNYKIKLKKEILNLWPWFILLIAVVWILNIVFGHHGQMIK